MNATGKRRQMELLGSSVSSAMRCSSSKRNVRQSNRRVCAVTSERKAVSARSVRRALTAKRRPKFPHGFLNSQAVLLPGLRGARCGLPGAPRSDRPQRFRGEALLFSLCLKNRMTFLQSLRIGRKRLADGRKEGDRSYVVKHLLQLGASNMKKLANIPNKRLEAMLVAHGIERGAGMSASDWFIYGTPISSELKHCLNHVSNYKAWMNGILRELKQVAPLQFPPPDYKASCSYQSLCCKASKRKTSTLQCSQVSLRSNTIRFGFARAGRLLPVFFARVVLPSCPAVLPLARLAAAALRLALPSCPRSSCLSFVLLCPVVKSVDAG